LRTDSSGAPLPLTFSCLLGVLWSSGYYWVLQVDTGAVSSQGRSCPIRSRLVRR